MLKNPWMKFSILIGFSVLMSFPVFAQEVLCREIYKPESQISSLPNHPMSRAIEQLLVTRDKVLEFLDIFSPQTQRQIQKLSREIDKVTETFVRDGELSDRHIEKLMEFNESLGTYQARIEERGDMLNLEPLRLRRLLFVKEPIDPNFTYFANNLPGFGRVDLHFSREVAEYLSEPGYNRDMFFPTIFHGKVGAHGQHGLKELNSAEVHSPDHLVWRLFELKRVKTESRIVVMQTEGHLFFFKVFENHNRVDYINRENIPQLFFQSTLYNQWIK